MWTQFCVYNGTHLNKLRKLRKLLSYIKRGHVWKIISVVSEANAASIYTLLGSNGFILNMCKYLLSLKDTVICNMLCSPIEVDRRFEGTY
jgi:hypothetical protein